MSDTQTTPELTVNQAAFNVLNAKVTEGDKIRVVLKVPITVHGSDVNWVEEMDNTINKTLRVRRVDASNGSFYLSNGYWYPAVALSTEVAKITVPLPDYTAEITKEQVNVGCQILTKEMILGIVQGALDVGFLSEEDVNRLDTREV